MSGYSLDRFWEVRITSPKPSRCAMFQKSLSVPLAFSWSASRTKKSSFLAAESASICLSHRSQSFSDSHRPSSANSSGGKSLDFRFEFVYLRHGFPFHYCYCPGTQIHRPDARNGVILVHGLSMPRSHVKRTTRCPLEG